MSVSASACLRSAACSSGESFGSSGTSVAPMWSAAVAAMCHFDWFVMRIATRRALAAASAPASGIAAARTSR